MDDKHPAPPCLGTDGEPLTPNQMIREIYYQHKEMHRAIVGNREYKQEGLLEIAHNHGRRISRIERTLIYVAGFGGAISILYKVFSDFK